jgi:hypothetical protein
MAETGKRQCNLCKSEMIKSSKEPMVKGAFFWGELYEEYICQSCNHKTDILLTSSILYNIFTSLFGLGLLVYSILNFDEFLSWFSLGISGWVLAAIIALIFSILILGSFFTTRTSIKAIRHNIKYPNLNPGFVLLSFFLTMVISALPVVFSIGFGMYDFYVKDINEGATLILLPVIFSPLFLGTKLGLSFAGLFMGCCFWMGILVTAIMVF